VREENGLVKDMSTLNNYSKILIYDRSNNT
jgi:hypothetical protein